MVGKIILVVVAIFVIMIIIGWVLGGITGRQASRNIQAILDKAESKKNNEHQ